MYVTIVLFNTTYYAENDSVPKNNSQKNADNKIEDSHHCISELV